MKRFRKTQPAPTTPLSADDMIRAARASAGAQDAPVEPGERPTLMTMAAPTAAEAAIVCDNLVKIYKIAELEVFALQGLDLVVNRGELLGIVGASGSGKSTLMNILGGLDRPSAGRVWVDGMDLLNMSDSALDRYRRTMVGFVWQQGGRNLIPYLNAIENIELPMTLAGLAGKEKRKRAEELLDAVGLTARRKHRLSELSGGEQQRVAIAVALANSPHLLLADEPTGELDSNTALAIYKTFRDLNEIYNLTILIVSHDPAIARHVNRVVAIRDGKLATETVRQTRAITTLGEPNSDGEEQPAEVTHEEVLQELIVLDSAGRLQIPKDYLQRMGVSSRVTLEVTEQGILIKPVEDTGHVASAEDLGAVLAASKRTGKKRPLHTRLLDKVMDAVNPSRRNEG